MELGAQAGLTAFHSAYQPGRGGQISAPDQQNHHDYLDAQGHLANSMLRSSHKIGISRGK